MKSLLTGLAVFTLSIALSGESHGDLVAHWTGDNTAVDATGNGHNGTINGATFATGVFGDAFAFDGSNDSVIVSANADLEPSSLSISLWVKAVQETHIRNLIDSTHGAGQSGFALQIDAANNMTFAYGNGSGFPQVNGAFNVFDGDFHHVVATLDGTTMRLYFDGVAGPTVAYSGIVSPSGRDIQIGHSLPLNRPLDGFLDDVRLYNHTLSALEVSALFSPVPEPASGFVLALTALGLLGTRRRR